MFLGSSPSLFIGHPPPIAAPLAGHSLLHSPTGLSCFTGHPPGGDWVPLVGGLGGGWMSGVDDDAPMN